MVLTQAHIIRKRQEQKDYQTQSMKALKAPQKYIIEPKKTLNKDSVDLVTPPYDAVDFKGLDRDNEIEAQTEDHLFTTAEDETKVLQNSEDSFIKNNEKLMKTIYSESDESLKSSTQNSDKPLSSVQILLLKAKQILKEDNIEASSSKGISVNEDILTERTIKPGNLKESSKKDNQNNESAGVTADDINRKEISFTNNSIKISDFKALNPTTSNSENQNPILNNSENQNFKALNFTTNNSENNLNFTLQNMQLSVDKTNSKDKKLEASEETKQPADNKQQVNKNSLENPHNDSQAANDSEKKSIFSDKNKVVKQTVKPISEQKLNKNDLNNLETQPEVLHVQPEKIKMESTTDNYVPVIIPGTESVPSYTPISMNGQQINPTKPITITPNTTTVPEDSQALESTTNVEKVSDFVSSTTPSAIVDGKASETPTIPSATYPTRWPILSLTTRRPIPQRPQPPSGIRPPAWFTNIPLLPINFFISPSNTTNSTTNPPTNNFGFGIFAIPWNWRPFNNITSFFSPNRILETRPPVRGDSIASTESRDMAFWNAIFHQDYQGPHTAVKKDTPQATKTSENAKDTYWSNWNLKFLKFFNDNNETNKPATGSANTKLLHVYVPFTYPIKGQIVQLSAQNVEPQKSTNKVKTLAKAGIDSLSDPVKQRAIDSITHQTDDIAAVSSKEKANEKSSLMLELEIPKPGVQLFQGLMNTFMPQQN